uniref:Uncharacterized protein n=1 Tax=Anguilla anguilla TaxID=7936 RepID=A0A0E9SM17_ANGAN
MFIAYSEEQDMPTRRIK